MCSASFFSKIFPTAAATAKSAAADHPPIFLQAGRGGEGGRRRGGSRKKAQLVNLAEADSKVPKGLVFGKSSFAILGAALARALAWACCGATGNPISKRFSIVSRNPVRKPVRNLGGTVFDMVFAMVFGAGFNCFLKAGPDVAAVFGDATSLVRFPFGNPRRP